MLYVILGENTYKSEQELRQIIDKSKLGPENIDASALDANTLADIMRGGSLFSEKRLVVLKRLSDNKLLLDLLATWADDLPDDTTLVVVEPKLDKRTKAYKSLVKSAKVISAQPLTERDHGMAEEWLRTLAHKSGVGLSPRQVQDMVARAMVAGDKPSARVIDQMQLAQGLSALSSLAEVTDDAIDTVLPPAVGDTVFDLLEMAASGDKGRVNALLDDLMRSDDPHRTLAMLMGQWAQLVAVALADTPYATAAVELGIHPFVVKKLQELARKFTRDQLRDLTQLAAELDSAIKLSQFAPWDGVYRFIYAILARN